MSAASPSNRRDTGLLIMGVSTVLGCTPLTARRGLPTPSPPDGVWLVDVAAGDSLYEPIPLRRGEYVNGGRRVDHDKRGRSRGVEISLDPHPVADQAKICVF